MPKKQCKNDNIFQNELHSKRSKMLFLKTQASSCFSEVWTNFPMHSSSYETDT